MQVVTVGPLSVTEGDGPEYIEVMTNLPPAYFCLNRTLEDDDDVCKIAVWTYVDPAVDLQCYETNENVSQLAFGYMPDYPDDYRRTCGLFIGQLNWHETLRVPVYALMDGVVDGDVSRTVRVHHQVEYDSSYMYGSELGIVEVRQISHSQALVHHRVVDVE